MRTSAVEMAWRSRMARNYGAIAFVLLIGPFGFGLWRTGISDLNAVSFLPPLLALLVGIAFVYMFTAHLVNKTRIEVQGQAVRVSNGPLKWPWLPRRLTVDPEQFQCKRWHWHEYYYYLAAKVKGADTIRLTPCIADEARVLKVASELNHALGGMEGENEGDYEPKSPGGGGNVESSSMNVARILARPFTLSLPFLLFALIFITIGVGLVKQQAYRLTAYQSVAAEVLEVGIDHSTGSDGAIYRPRVLHRYEVDGREYTSDNALPMDISGSDQSWAQRIVSRFQKGEKVTAWVSPEDPNRSYLVREVSFLPYMVVLFAMLLLAIGAAVMAETPSRARLTASPQRGVEGFYALAPLAPRRIQVLAAAGITIAWWLIGLAAFGHYRGLGGELTTLASIVLGGYSILGLGGIGIFVRNLLLWWPVRDALVLIDRPSASVGEDLGIYVERVLKRGLRVNAIEVGLVCEEHYKDRSGNKIGYRQRERYRSEQKLEPVDSRPVVGEAVRFVGTLHLPTDQPPSKHGGDYPRYQWFITVHTDIASGRDYKAKYPLTVDPARASGPGSPDRATSQGGRASERAT